MVDRVGNDKSLCGSSAFEGCMDGAFVVANENIFLYKSFLSDVPVEVAGDHVVLDLSFVVLVVFLDHFDRFRHHLFKNCEGIGSGETYLSLLLWFLFFVAF